MIYGYARVSMDGESMAAQVKQFARFRRRESLSRNGQRSARRPRPIAADAEKDLTARRRADGDVP